MGALNIIELEQDAESLGQSELADLGRSGVPQELKLLALPAPRKAKQKTRTLAPAVRRPGPEPWVLYL